MTSGPSADPAAPAAGSVPFPVTPAMEEGYAPFGEHRTWYGLVGSLTPGDLKGPAPLLVLHGGPGGAHDYLLSLSDLAADGRAVIFYDQLGSGRSTHLPDQEPEFWTPALFAAQLVALIEHLGIAGRYHLLGQSWGGFLALEHAVTQPAGLVSLVLSDTAASCRAFAEEAERLRAGLPADVQETLSRHEAAGTTDSAEYALACEIFYRRHLCRLDPWPTEVTRGFQLMAEDPTVYHVMNGPSEFHIVGSLRDWEVESRLHLVSVPTLVISGRHDEATPKLQEALVRGIQQTHQVLLENSSHMPFWEERAVYMEEVGQWLAAHDHR